MSRTTYIYCQNCKEVKELGICTHKQHQIEKIERPFVPYYDPVLRCEVTSWADAERKAIAHRSASHPDGLRLVQWDRKQINEYKNIARHKEDYNKQYYNDPEKAEKAKFGKTKYFIAIALLFFSTNAFALIADYMTFEIKGVKYEVPIPNRKTREDFILIKRALKGDEISREALLGGSDVKWFFIGDVGVVRWLKLTKDDVEVTEIK